MYISIPLLTAQSEMSPGFHRLFWCRLSRILPSPWSPWRAILIQVLNWLTHHQENYIHTLYCEYIAVYSSAQLLGCSCKCHLNPHPQGKKFPAKLHQTVNLIGKRKCSWWITGLNARSREHIQQNFGSNPTLPCETKVLAKQTS